MDKLMYFLGHPAGTAIPSSVTSLPLSDRQNIQEVLGRLAAVETALQQTVLDSVASKAGSMDLAPLRAANMQRLQGRGLVVLLSRLSGVPVLSDIFEVQTYQWRVPG